MKKTTIELLDILSVRFHGNSFLDIGSMNGEVALWAAERGIRPAYFSTDLIPCRAVDRTRVDVHYSSRLPDATFETITMDSTLLDTPLAIELSLQVADNLAHDGEFMTVPPSQWSVQKWIDHLCKVYQEVFIVSESDGAVVVSCRKPERVWEPTRYSINVPMADTELRFQSAPGIFSPQSADRGTMAMLFEMQKLGPQNRVLDLGCGAGVVSVYLATLWGANVTASDTNAIAIDVTRDNAIENGVADQIKVVASDGFSDIEEMDFDIVATNPPYHSDYSVAKRFITGAHKHLRAGGRLWVVIKRPDWYINRIRSVFGGCTVIQNDGYFVLTAVKKPRAEMRLANPSNKTPAPSKKHLKKMQDAEQRKKHRPRHF